MNLAKFHLIPIKTYLDQIDVLSDHCELDSCVCDSLAE